jgi:hypothetical protein
MSIRNAIEVVTELAQQGVIRQYAITGAVAALNYIQPSLTEELDVLVSIRHFEECQKPELKILFGAPSFSQ